ncbi:DUF945 family protein [Marinobacter sp.]|uniref:DUF945 family protein n=1 Tax=Marinobacter sp. TaxID=50741 RepID=UPI0034A192F8
MKKTVVVVGVVVLAAAVSAPWVMGTVTEQQWHQAMSDVNGAQRFVRLETGEYERGYLGGQFDGTVVIDDPASDQPMEFDYQARVSHGITGSLLEFSLADDVPEEVSGLFTNDKPRLTLETRFWGTAVAELTMPTVSVVDEESGGTLQSSGGYARADISDGGADVDLTVVWPGMVMTTPEMNLSLQDVRLEQGFHHLRGDVWTGEGEVELKALELAFPGQESLNLDGFNLASKTWTTDGDNTLHAETTATLDSLTAGAETFGPHRLQFVMEDLDVDSWNTLTAALSELQVAAMDQGGSPGAFNAQMASMQQMNGAMMDLAAEGFGIGFPEISLMTPDGEVRGQVMIGHPALSDEERAKMLMVMQRLTGEMDVSLPVALAEDHPALMMQIAPLIKQGMMTEEGDRFRLSAELKDLALDVNGVILPLPPLL